MIEQARTVAIACKTLENEVKIFSEGISEEISREIDLEKRSVFAELKQVVSQLNNVKNFDGTRVSLNDREYIYFTERDIATLSNKNSRLLQNTEMSYYRQFWLWLLQRKIYKTR